MRKPSVTFLLFLAMLSSPIHAHEHTAYSQESTLNYKNPDWMKNLRDDTRLSDLSMLGTHDSLGLYGDPILGKNSPAPLAITQTLPLSEQLNSGIRLFDIRLRMVKGGALVVHHGIVYQRANFDDVLSTMVQFLQAHPTEVVSMRIQKECLPTGTYPINTLIAQCVDEEDQPSFSDRLNSYFSKNQYKNYIFYENLRNPNLGQLRGKIVLIESNDSPGIKTDNFYTQFDKAHYGLKKSIDLYKKWEGIKEFLEAAKNRKNNWGYMALLSGCGLFEDSYTDVIYPFFVASGHMLAGTNALNQTTGIRVAPTDRTQYPDFPREYCSDKECTIMYEGTNILTYQYIIENKPSYVGIVVADFPGPGLIDAVINSNSMNLIPGPYSHDKKVNSGNENASWMARLKDATSIGNLSVPGTHSSISLSGGDALQTQSMSLLEQLNSGIRAFDIQQTSSGQIVVYRNQNMHQEADFENDVLKTMVDFLKTHPSETLFLIVKTDPGRRPDELVLDYFDSDEYKNYFSLPRSTLGQVRGKIVLMWWGQFNGNVQDQYAINAPLELYSKWNEVKKQLNATRNRTNNEVYVNYLSAAGNSFNGPFPYFVASGHSFSGTNSPRLSTGLKVSATDYSQYPDFPRADCAGGQCTIFFEGINTLAYSDIVKNKSKYVGFVMADFPGPTLIDAVIQANF